MYLESLNACIHERAVAVAAAKEVVAVAKVVVAVVKVVGRARVVVLRAPAKALQARAAGAAFRSAVLQGTAVAEPSRPTGEAVALRQLFRVDSYLLGAA